MYVIPESLTRFVANHTELDSSEAIIAWFELQLTLDDHVEALGDVALEDLEGSRSTWLDAQERGTYDSESIMRGALSIGLRTRMTVEQLACWYNTDPYTIARHAAARKHAEAWLAFADYMENVDQIRFISELAKEVGVGTDAISNWLNARPHWRAKKVDRGRASQRMLELFTEDPTIGPVKMVELLRAEGFEIAKSTVRTNIGRWRAIKNREEGRPGDFPYAKKPGPYVERLKVLAETDMGPIAVYRLLQEEGFACSKTQVQTWLKRFRSDA